jgi:SAM-dependent methyltransferase
MKLSKKHTKTKGADGDLLFDKYALYQHAVQEPEADIEFIDQTFTAQFRRKPRTLREDFCAAAYLACEWIKHNPANRAWGVDLNSESIAWGLTNNASGLNETQAERLTLVEGDVLDVCFEPVDVLVAFNFSYYCLKTRAELLRYFSAAHRNLGSEGLFVSDIYGGPEAQELVEETTVHDDFHYLWDQDEFDPIQSRMSCHIHFELPSGERLERAFSYDWRLWTIPEVREVLTEAGFAATEIYWEGIEESSDEGNGVFTLQTTAENTESWTAYIVGIKE